MWNCAESPQRFFDLGENCVPIAFLGHRPDKTVGDRAVALDDKSFGYAIDAKGADPRDGIA
jgi:hypothetical protein